MMVTFVKSGSSHKSSALYLNPSADSVCLCTGLYTSRAARSVSCSVTRSKTSRSNSLRMRRRPVTLLKC